jgi:nucleoside phosphorylase
MTTPSAAANQNVLVCYAVKEEVGSRVVALRGAKVLVTGIGQRNAARGIEPGLADGPYRFVLTCGFAGGLDPVLKTGGVLFEEDPGLDLADRLRRLGAIPAKFHCAQRVAVTAQEKRVLRDSTGADAVEMESGVIRTLCHQKGIPSATIRVILDTATEDLPLDFNALMTSQDKLNLPKLVGTVLLKPQKIPALRRLQANTNLAREQLDKVIEGLLRQIT